MTTASDLISEVTKRPAGALDRATMLDTLPAFDSIALVNLVVRLEDTIGRQLLESELEGLRTVGAIDDLLKA
jgi:acyl carrier protein